MFVKKIPRWKIKRFIKGVIRSILFFVVLSSFIISCNAGSVSGVYDSWNDLVDDSLTTFHVNFSDGFASDSSITLFNDPSQPYMYYNLYNNRPIRDCSFDFFGDNVLTSFKANDVFIFSGSAKVVFNDKSFDSSSFADSCYFAFNLHKSSSNTSVYQRLNYTFSEFDYSSSFDNDISSQTYGNYVLTVNYSIEHNFSYDGEITSFEIHLGGMESARAFILYPGQTSIGEQIVYYVGDRESAPIFKLPDQSGLDEGQQAEDDLIDFSQEGFLDWNDIFALLPSAINNVLNWLEAAGDIIEMFYLALDWPFNGLVLVLLSIGLLSFAIGITTSIISKFER